MAGLLLDNIRHKVGVANMLARMMTQGTRIKPHRSWKKQYEQLGASINVFAGHRRYAYKGEYTRKKTTSKR